MLASRFGARSRTLFTQCRSSLPLIVRRNQPAPVAAVLSNRYHSLVDYRYHSLVDYRYKVVPEQVSLLNHSFNGGSSFQRFGISSSASPQENKDDTAQSGTGSGENGDSTKGSMEADGGKHDVSGSNAEHKSDASNSVKGKKRRTKWLPFSNSDSDSETDLSKDELIKLLAEREAQLLNKDEELKTVQDKALRTCAEMQNSMDRTKRDAENMKKFAIQNFVKDLLDVADNLSRASLAVKDNFLKIDESKDTVGAMPLLKTLLQGVEMTEKQLSEIFKKYGVQKYDPINEEFDPHRHNAVFQVPDPTKPPNTVAAVLKAGYTLHDRVLRPAEVGVTNAAENESDQSAET